MKKINPCALLAVSLPLRKADVRLRRIRVVRLPRSGPGGGAVRLRGEVSEATRPPRPLVEAVVPASCARSEYTWREWSKIALGPSPTTGGLIRLCRTLRGLRQHDLAAALGVGQSRVADLEADRCSPTVGMLRRVAEALGVDAGDLI